MDDSRVGFTNTCLCSMQGRCAQREGDSDGARDDAVSKDARPCVWWASINVKKLRYKEAEVEEIERGRERRVDEQHIPGGTRDGLDWSGHVRGGPVSMSTALGVYILGRAQWELCAGCPHTDEDK